MLHQRRGGSRTERRGERVDPEYLWFIFCTDVCFAARAEPEHQRLCARLYDNTDATGKTIEVKHFDRVPRMGKMNDKVSSVKVEPGCHLILYRHADFEGFTFTVCGFEDLSKIIMGLDYWHNRLSSYQCFCDGGEDFTDEAATWPDFQNRHILNPRDPIPSTPQGWQDLMNRKNMGYRYRNTFVIDSPENIRNSFRNHIQPPPKECRAYPRWDNFFKSVQPLKIVHLEWDGTQYLVTQGMAWVTVGIVDGLPVHFQRFEWI